MSRITIDTDDLQSVPADVRLQLAEALWDSLEDSSAKDPTLTPAELAELDLRLADYRAHPEQAEEWQEFRERLRRTTPTECP